MATATSVPSFPTSTVVTMSTPSDGSGFATGSTNNSDSTTLRLVATIVPIVIIVAITIWGLLVAGGVMHHRRRYRASSSSADSFPSSTYNEKWPAGMQEPKLWEVRLEHAGYDGLEQDYKPLSVELQSDVPALPYSKDQKLRKKTDDSTEEKTKKRWRSQSIPAPLDLQSQQVQVTVIVAMPSPRHNSSPLDDCAIGTRQLMYKFDATESRQEPRPTQHVVDTPIIMEMSAYGYIG